MIRQSPNVRRTIKGDEKFLRKMLHVDASMMRNSPRAFYIIRRVKKKNQDRIRVAEANLLAWRAILLAFILMAFRAIRARFVLKSQFALFLVEC